MFFGDHWCASCITGRSTSLSRRWRKKKMWKWLVICLRALSISLKTRHWEPVFFNSWVFCLFSILLLSSYSLLLSVHCWTVDLSKEAVLLKWHLSVPGELCPKVLWNVYDKWQPAPPRHLAVWKHLSAPTMEGCVGTAAFCLSADTSQFPCFTNVLKMFMLHEYQTEGFSFFPPMINMKISVEHIITNLF